MTGSSEAFCCILVSIERHLARGSSLQVAAERDVAVITGFEPCGEYKEFSLYLAMGMSDLQQNAF